MKSFYTSIQFVLLSFLLFGITTVFGQTQTANYNITFQSSWSNTTHPFATFPGSAHWSNLVGATHNNNIVFVAAGALATPGIESVAETGISTTFETEVTNSINTGNADQYIEQPFSSFAALSNVTKDITVDKDYPLLSLASMIAPSPDWMIQVNSISLTDVNGNWVPLITMDLFPYDAGTEEGDTYSFSNPPTSPHIPIFSLQGISPFSNEKVGTLTVTLLTLGIEDINHSESIYFVRNQAKQHLNIYNISNTNIEQIEVYDVFGKFIKQIQLNSNENSYSLATSDLKNGLYFIKLQSQQSSITKKVLL